MADNILQLLFKADTKELDDAKEKLVGIGKEMPNVGGMIEGLIDKFKNIPGPIGLAVAAVAGFGFAVTEMVKGTIEAETRLLELSEAMGIPVEKAQPFIEAMALAGVTGERLQGSLGKLSMAVGQALTEPTGKAADAFKKLGISQKELAEGDIEQIMKDAAAGFDKYADSATKTAAIRELFGKQGPVIMAAMQNEAEMEKLAADAQEQYGTKVSEADAKSAKYFGETLKLGATMFEGLSMSVTKSLLPGLQELVNQFAESGKQGGFMRDILDGLSATISVVAKVLIEGLVIPIKMVVEVFQAAGMAIGGAMAAIDEAAHGHFKAAGQTILQVGKDINALNEQTRASFEKFEKKLWDTSEAVKDQGAAVDDTKPKFEAYDKNAQKVSDTLEQLRIKLQAQSAIWAAAATGMDAYKKAQDDVTIAEEKRKLQAEGASKAAIAEAEALMRKTLAAKEGTQDEVAGWGIINRLTAEHIGLLTHETELQKQLEEISKHPGMTQAQKDEAIALATTNAELKDQERLKKELQGIDDLVTNSIEKEKAAMTLSTNQMKLYNQEQLLRKKYADALKNDPGHEKELQADLQKNLTLLKANDAETKTWTQSMEGFGAGAKQAMQNAYDEATNLNKMGGELVKTFNDGLTNAFVKAMQGGKDAFKELIASIGQLIVQQLLHFAIVEAELAILAYYGITGPSAAVLVGGTPGVTKNANGNAFANGGITAFADGGIVSQPTYFNMGLMGEAGPEAIMPLQRDSQGRLGVSAGGGNSSSGSEVHFHAPAITINSNQDPHEIAKQTKKVLNMHQTIIKSQIAKEQRVGGMLHKQQPMFAN